MRRRRLVFLFLGIVGLLGVLILGVRWYIGSEKVALQVASKVEAALGMPVAIGSVDVRSSSVSLRDVSIFAARADQATAADRPPAPQNDVVPPPKPDSEQTIPWLTVRRLKTDLTPAGLIRGQTTPTRVEAEGVNVVLQFDQNGDLIAPKFDLPSSGGELPALSFTDSRLEISQQGHLPFVITGLNGALADPATREFKGTADDPEWGRWNVTAQLPKDQEPVTVLLTTESANLATKRLQSIPFVPPVVWENVQIEGNAQVTVRLAINQKAKEVKYHVELASQGATVHVTSVGTTLTETSGRMEIDNGLITLVGASGKTADGQATIDGTLDFRTTPNVLQLKVNADRLDVQRLPERFSVPPVIEGRFVGSADLGITLTEPRPIIRGNGSGKVTEARIAGLDVQSIAIDLVPTSEGLRLSPRLTGLLFPPAKRAEAAEVAKPEAANGAAPTSQGYVVARTSLSDAALEQVAASLPWTMKRANLTGRVDVDVTLVVPLDITDAAAAAGELQLKVREASINGVPVSSAVMTGDIVNGVLQTNTLRIDVGTEKEPVATATGSVKAAIIPAGDVDVTLDLSPLPFQTVATLAAVESGGFDGSVQGKLQGNVRLADVTRIPAWQVNGNLTGTIKRSIGEGEIPLSAKASLANGLLTLSNLNTKVSGLTLNQSSVQIGLVAPFPLTVSGDVQTLTFQAIHSLLTSFGVESPALLTTSQGTWSGTIEGEGTWQPVRVNWHGTVLLTDGQVSKFKLPRVPLTWSVDRDNINLALQKAEVYGGTVTGTATGRRTKPTDRWAIDMSFDQLDSTIVATELAPAYKSVNGPISGSATGTIEIPTSDQPATFLGTARVYSSVIKYGVLPLERLDVEAIFDRPTIALTVTGKLLDGTFDLRGKVPTGHDPNVATSVDMKLERARLQRIGELSRTAGQPTPIEQLRGTVDLQYQGSIRPEGGRPTGSGTVVVSNLRYQDRILSSQLQGKLQQTSSGIQVRNFGGRIAEGQVFVDGNLGITSSRQRWFRLRLENLDSKSLLFLVPAAAEEFSGSVSGLVRGRHEQNSSGWRGTADLRVSRAKVSKLELNEWVIPLTWYEQLSPSGFVVEARQSSATLANGRALLDLNAFMSSSPGTPSKITGNFKLSGSDLGVLVRVFSPRSSVASGTLGGNADFTGVGPFATNDWTANVQANFSNAQALQLPVLSVVAPSVFPGQAAGGAIFQTGILTGNLRNGVFHIGQFGLDGRLGQIFIEGDVAVSGRLQLDVTATSTPIDKLVGPLGQFGLPTDRLANIPLKALQSISAQVADRMVHVTVTGTWQNPNVRVTPLPLLTEGALRFFTGALRR